MVVFLAEISATDSLLSVLALSSRFDGQTQLGSGTVEICLFQYSLCRVVLMVRLSYCKPDGTRVLSVLALSSRFDGRGQNFTNTRSPPALSVLALSSRFDGQGYRKTSLLYGVTFSTRSVESF